PAQAPPDDHAGTARAEGDAAAPPAAPALSADYHPLSPWPPSERRGSAVRRSSSRGLRPRSGSALFPDGLEEALPPHGGDSEAYQRHMRQGAPGGIRSGERPRRLEHPEKGGTGGV